MDRMNLIKTRKSVRTFDGRPLSAEKRSKLQASIDEIRNPYDIPVSFVWLDAEAHGLSSPVIAGEHLYIAGKVPRAPHCEEAFGYSFEKHTMPGGAAWDVQKIDVGIALCNFMTAAGGRFSINDPGLETPENIEYIATVTL